MPAYSCPGSACGRQPSQKNPGGRWKHIPTGDIRPYGEMVNHKYFFIIPSVLRVRLSTTSPFRAGLVTVSATRYDRLVDRSPCRDIHRGDVVGWTSESTRTTEERTSIRTVRSMHIPTVWAGLRGVGGRNDHHRHPGEPRLVPQLCQLVTNKSVLRVLRQTCVLRHLGRRE